MPLSLRGMGTCSLSPALVGWWVTPQEADTDLLRLESLN